MVQSTRVKEQAGHLLTRTTSAGKRMVMPAMTDGPVSHSFLQTKATGKRRKVQQRIYQQDDGYWYYRARGNQVVGPFDSHHDAEQSLQKVIHSWAGPKVLKSAWPRTLSPARLLRRSAARHS